MTRLMYDEKVVCEIMTNRSVSMDEMLEFFFDDYEEAYNQGVPGFYEFDGLYLFDVENAEMIRE